MGVRGNSFVAILAACGVIIALGRPWYGPPVPPTGERVHDLFGGIGRAFAEPAGVHAWAAFETADQLLTGLAVATAALLLIGPVRALARWTALGAVVLVLVKLIDGPATSEPRHGALLALAAALVLLGSTWSVASCGRR